MTPALSEINDSHRPSTATATVKPDSEAVKTSSLATAFARADHGASVGGDGGSAIPTACQPTQGGNKSAVALIIGQTAGTRNLHVISPTPVVFTGVVNVSFKNPVLLLALFDHFHLF